MNKRTYKNLQLDLNVKTRVDYIYGYYGKNKAVFIGILKEISEKYLIFKDKVGDLDLEKKIFYKKIQKVVQFKE